MIDSRRLTGVSEREPSQLSLGTALQRPPDADPIGVWYAILAVLRRRRLLALCVFLAVVALVLAVTIVTPKRYTVGVKLIAGNPGTMVSETQGQTGLPVLNALVMPNATQSAETYVELLGERPVVERVRDDLKLDTSVDALAAAVKIKPVTNTNIISLSATWSDPQTAAAIANSFATVFIDRQTELISGQATSELNVLATQIPVAANTLRQAEARVTAFETTHKIANLDATTAAMVNAAASTDAKINAIALEKRQAEAQIASLRSQLAGLAPSSSNGQNITQNPVLQQLRAQLAQDEAQLESAQEQYTDEHPAVKLLKHQIEGLRQQIAHTPQTVVAQVNSIANPVYNQQEQLLGVARTTSAADSAQLAVLRDQRAAIDRQLATLPATSRQLTELQRQQKSAENVYNALQAKKSDLLVSKTTALSDVTITEPATAYAAVKSPSLTFNAVIGTVVGLLIALATAFLVDWLDGRIRDEDDVEVELGLPVLASIPLLPSNRKNGKKGMVPATLSRAFQESHFQLVLAMRYSSDRPLRSIAITSPLKGDGKSTIALNVSAALGEIAVSGENGEERVLVIDADMRCPMLHGKFGVENDLGLTDILIGRATLADCVRRTDRPGVDILTSGAHSPNPIKLLQSSRFEALLDEAQQRYVTVVIDSPALIPVFDAAIIAAKADGTMMVVSAGRTDVRSMRKALARLMGVGVKDLIGTVVNCATKFDDYNDYFSAASGLKELTSSA